MHAVRWVCCVLFVQAQAEQLLATLRALLLKDTRTAPAMKQRVLQPLQAAITNFKSATSAAGGSGEAIWHSIMKDVDAA